MAGYCPECGAALPTDSPRGLCPQCLLALIAREEGVGAGSARSPDKLADATVPSLENASPGTPGEAVRFFGDYELLEEIGRGGMGVVFKARQKSLDRLVAVKTLLPGLSSPEYLRRFRTEASTAAALQHPNIVAIHEVGVWQDQQYLVMDYVPGPSLAQVISNLRFEGSNFRKPAQWMKAIAEAVHYAHEHGILHRDLKPSNILIDPAEAPRVTDFGLAKRFAEQSQLTLSGQALGSPSYMPPEQAGAHGGKVSRRSDVYGLGATLYHLLTGRPPFQGQIPTDVLHQVLNADPLAPRQLNPNVPRDLETICLKCLEKEPGKRYADAGILAEELDRFLQGKPILARPISPTGMVWRWCRRKPLVASLSAGLVLVLFLGLAGVLWQWQRAERVAREEVRQRARAEASELQARRRAYASDMKAAQVALQQDDLGLAVNLLRRHMPQPGQEDLRGIEWRYLWQESQSDEVQRFAHPLIVEVAALSPDGQFLATKGHDRKIRIWEVASGKQLLDFQAAAFDQPRKAVAFSPEGKWLVAPGQTPDPGDALTRPAKAGLEVRDTADWRVVRRLESAEAPFCFSRDGRRLVTMGDGGLLVWDTRDWSYRLRPRGQAEYGNLAFTSDGAEVVYSAANFADFTFRAPIQSWHVDKGTQTAIEGEDLSVSLATSPDGKWLASANNDGQICLWDLATRVQVAKFRAHRALTYALAFSPDGRLLATGGADQMIHLWEAGTTNRVRSLRGHLHEVRSLDFSRDGQTLVSASKDGTARLWRVQAGPRRSWSFTLATNEMLFGPLPDGSAVLTTRDQEQETRFTEIRRLPDGRVIGSIRWSENWTAAKAVRSGGFIFPHQRLAVGVTTEGTVHFWRLPEGTHVREVRLGGEGFWPSCLSANQRWLVGKQTGEKLVLYDLVSARSVQQFADSRGVAAFSPDDRWLVYATRTHAIKLWDLASNRVKAALEGHNGSVDSLRFSPDSRLLASGGWEGKIWLWSVESGKPLFPPLEHPPKIQRLFYSFDGKTLITTAPDLTMRWWHLVTGQEMLRFSDCRMSPLPDVDSPAEWNPGGNVVLWWQSNSNAVRVTPLPTLAEIDAAQRPDASPRR